MKPLPLETQSLLRAQPQSLLSKQPQDLWSMTPSTSLSSISTSLCCKNLELNYVSGISCTKQSSSLPSRLSRYRLHARNFSFGLRRLGLSCPGSQSLALRRLGFPRLTKVCTVGKPLQQGVGCQATYVSAPGPATFEEEEALKEKAELEVEEIETKKPEPVVSWKAVASVVATEKKRIAQAVLALVVCTYCTLSMPLYSGAFFETLIGKRTGPLWRLLANIALAYVLEPIMTIVFVTNICFVWEKVMANLRERLFSRLLVQRVEFFDRHKVSELTSLMSVEMKVIQDTVLDNVSRDRGFRAMSEIMGALIILFTISPKLAPPLVVLIVGISVGLGFYRRLIAPIMKAYMGMQGKLTECASETFGAIRTVRSFSGESRQIGLFQTQVDACRENGIKLSWRKAANEAWTRMAVYVSMLSLYILGGTKVKSGELNVGVLLSFIGYTFTLTFGVQGLMNTLTDLRNLGAAAERINSLATAIPIDDSLAVGIERELRGDITLCPQGGGEGEGEGGVSLISPPPLRDHLERFVRAGGGLNGNGRTVLSEKGRLVIVDGREQVVPLEEVLADEAGRKKGVCELAWTGDIVLEGIHFAYPMRPDHMVLRGLTVRMKRGGVTALVGGSGSGKSTCVQLISRFYEPTVGRITLDGVDVRLFDKAEWTRAVSVVNQEPVLFAMSIADNIAYSLPEGQATRENIEAAAKAANAHDFIEKLSQGYDTFVGERGGLLSGGQKQRIAIARALLKNAPILILDEATSALDSISESLVQDALERLMRGRTTLVIAHRLSTVQKAEKIVVLSLGKVVEMGTHEELAKSGGEYSTLVNNQRLILGP